MCKILDGCECTLQELLRFSGTPVKKLLCLDYCEARYTGLVRKIVDQESHRHIY